MTRRSIVAAAAVFLIASQQAPASEFRVAIGAHSPVQQDLQLRLTSDALDIRHDREKVWSFAFKDDRRPEARLVVAFENPPVGYRTISWTFDVPYYRVGSAGLDVAVAISNDDSSDLTTRAFLRSARGLGLAAASIQQLALINHRARVIFSDRYGRVMQGHRSPEKDDVSVGYWLLLTSRELMEKSGFAPDEVTNLAASWISGIARDEDMARKLLGGDTVTPAAAAELIGSLQRRDELLKGRIIREISRDIGSARSSGEGCARAQGLKAWFDDLDMDALDRLDARREFSLETTVNVALCAARGLQARLRTNGPSEIDLAEARNLHDELVRVAEAAELRSAGRSLVARSRRHAAELLEFIRAAEARPSDDGVPSG